MPHKLIKLAEKIYNTPQLITPSGFQVVQDYLSERNLTGIHGMPALLEDDEQEPTEECGPSLVEGIGFVDISGPLSYRKVEAMCSKGGSYYLGIVEQCAALCEAGATTIVLNVSSGGGEAFGAFVSAEKVRKCADEYGVEIVCRVEEMAASAAYIWASIADEIIVMEDSRVGSIGVVIALQNNSEQLKQEGVKRTFVYAGANKIPFAEDGSFREEFIGELQSSVDKLYTRFTSFVDTHRKLEAGTALSTQAKMYDAEEAAAIGLVDFIMDDDQFCSYLLEKQNNKNGAGMIKGLLSKALKGTDAEMSTTNELLAQLAEMSGMVEQKDAALAEAERHLQELAGKLASFEAIAKEAEAQAEAVKEAAAKAALDARHTRLADVLGAESPALESTFSAIAGLSDEAFATVVEGFSTKFKQEASSEMFKEVGVSGEAKVEEAKQGESKEMLIIKQKLQSK